MAQNIYDDEVFFSGYSTLPRSLRGLDAAPEWPTLRRMVASVHAKRVDDLGCGFGWFCRWALQHGATAALASTCRNACSAERKPNRLRRIFAMSPFIMG